MTIEEKFNDWLNNLNKTETIDPQIVAFNFGLFETSEGYIMYLIGSKTFDPNDDDWAANIDFEPKEKYLHFDREEVATENWQEFLHISTELLGDYIHSDKYPFSILKDAEAVTTGFDDGVLVRIK